MSQLRCYKHLLSVCGVVCNSMYKRGADIHGLVSERSCHGQITMAMYINLLQCEAFWFWHSAIQGKYLPLGSLGSAFQIMQASA